MRVCFIGAGGVNFGSPEGSWNHAARVAGMENVEVAGIADPMPGLAARRVAEWRDRIPFRTARAFAHWREMVEALKPDACIIGVPPAAHGGKDPGNDLERALARKGTAIFIEKPLGCLPPAEIEETARIIEDSGVLTSVGYMFRYSALFEYVREVLDKVQVRPRHVILRYACSYSLIRKKDWWDRAQAGGPIVEQATHFVDIARWLAGEIDLDSVRAISLGAGMPLADQPPGVEDGVPEERRVFRSVSANFAFESGCLGSLMHTILLHGRNYETDIDIWGDGLHIAVHDPYGAMRVRVRLPRSDPYTERVFTKDDPYRRELEAFVEAAASGNRGLVRSTYADAFRTYAATWRISEKALERIVKTAL